LQIGIILLALATALIHLSLSFPDPVFILNGLGYLALTVAYFLPQLKAYHATVRWVFIGFAAVTIIAWVAIGMRTPLGYITKLIELVLIALLWMDKPQNM
jgi:hypothetical protein